MAEPGLTLHVRQSCSPAPRLAPGHGAGCLPRGWSTPILRALISTDSLPHPNPQPTLALGPVSSPRQQCLNHLLTLEMGGKHFVGGRVQEGWSVDQFGQTNREEQDSPNGSFHFHPYFSTYSTECTWPHREGGQAPQHFP